MKIAVPSDSNQGLDSLVYGHFGSAPYFITIDVDSLDVKVIENDNDHHEHGMCQPTGLLKNHGVDAIVTGGMGVRAIQSMNSSGIKVYRITEQMNVRKVLEKFSNNQLDEISTDQGCSHGDHDGHGCHD